MPRGKFCIKLPLSNDVPAKKEGSIIDAAYYAGWKSGGARQHTVEERFVECPISVVKAIPSIYLIVYRTFYRKARSNVSWSNTPLIIATNSREKLPVAGKACWWLTDCVNKDGRMFRGSYIFCMVLISVVVLGLLFGSRESD